MRKFLFILIYNILLLSLFLYTYFFSSNDIKLYYLKDVSGLNQEEALNVLKDFEITIEYVESDKERDSVLYSNPYANDLVYEKQMITLYVSKGHISEKYENLENKMLKDVTKYLSLLVNEYKIEIEINYVKNADMLDGLIYKQVSESEHISVGDKLQLYVISNPKYIILPDFTGYSYMDLLVYCNLNDIKIHIIYIPIIYPENHVISQSVSPGEAVMKGSNPITIYLSKEI